MEYDVRVRAQNALGESVWSEATGTPLAPPSGPTGPSVSTGAHTVSWGTVTGAARYEVQARLNGGVWSVQDAGTATSKDYAGVGDGIWEYQARACNAGGCGAWSGSLTVTVGDALLTVSPATSYDGNYTVSWQATSSPLVSTQLRERVDGGAWALVGAYAWSVTSETFTAKAAGVYEYRTEWCLSILGNTTGQPSAGPVSHEVLMPGVPDVPAAPTLTADSEQITAAWAAPDDNGSAIDGYDVRYKRTGDANWTDHGFTGTGTTTTITGLTNGQEYEVQVQATNGVGPSGYSASGTVTPTAAPLPPDAPGTVTLTPGDEELVVEWDVPADNGAAITGYDVEYKRTGDASWTDHGFTGTGTTTTITGLTNGQEYEVQVRARNAEGFSDWTRATGEPMAVPDVPAAPTLTADSEQITAAWAAPDDNGSPIDGYDVRYKRTGDANWTDHGFTGTGTTTTITGLTNGQEYEVQVQATNGVGPSGYSASGTVTPTAAALPPDAPAPTVVTATGELVVEWDVPADNGAAITGYDVEYKRTGDANWTDHGFTGTGTTTTITGLTNGQEYEVQVRARNAEGFSAWARTMGTPLAAPAAPTGPGTSTGTHTVSWDTVTGAVYYELQTRLDAGGWTLYNTGSATSRAFSGQAGGPWDYQVRACNAGGCSDWSATLALTVLGFNGVAGGAGAGYDPSEPGGRPDGAGGVGPHRHPARRVPGGGERRGHLQHPAGAAAGHCGGGAATGTALQQPARQRSAGRGLVPGRALSRHPLPPDPGTGRNGAAADLHGQRPLLPGRAAPGGDQRYLRGTGQRIQDRD